MCYIILLFRIQKWTDTHPHCHRCSISRSRWVTCSYPFPFNEFWAWYNEIVISPSCKDITSLARNSELSVFMSISEAQLRMISHITKETVIDRWHVKNGKDVRIDKIICMSFRYCEKNYWEKIWCGTSWEGGDCTNFVLFSVLQVLTLYKLFVVRNVCCEGILLDWHDLRIEARRGTNILVDKYHCSVVFVSIDGWDGDRSVLL